MRLDKLHIMETRRNDMNTKRFWWLRLVVVLVVLLLGGTLFAMHASAGSQETRYRWDIPIVDFTTGTISAGGIASAKAVDGSMITLTGQGTFVPGDGFGNHDVTGGGTWQTFDSSGKATASGTYKVTGFVSWTVAPGTPPLPHDTIGDLEDERAGLAVVTIEYSDGSTGVLTLNCGLAGSPASIPEGITASMGFVDYYSLEPPPPPPSPINNTIFHILD
jgi:hypothetical protein